MRQYDAGYAIAEAKKLPWVDESNVFLMGLSEEASLRPHSHPRR